MPASTIAMPCNDSGFMDSEVLSAWGVLSWDWSNAKQVWVNEKPMDAETALVRQALAVKALNPTSRTFVYRNSVHAMPWFPTVRKKLRDPQYSGFFLSFAGRPPLPNGSYFSPPCEPTNKSLCNMQYHDQTQTPSVLPSGDGICLESCDCGAGIPCGFYLFNHRNGSMIRDWLVSEYFVGPTSVGHPAIDGLFVDDYWCDSRGTCPLRGRGRLVGPAETEPHVLQDLGMGDSEVDAMALAWRENLDAALEEIRRKNGTTWDLSFSFNSYNDPKAGAMTVPRPSIITKATCAAVLARECAPSDRSSVEYNGVDHLGKSPKLCCCVTASCPGPCPADCPRLRDIPLFYGLNYTSKSALSDPDPHIRLPMLEQDLAGFHLVRGDYAWLGFGFLSCHPDTNYTLPQSLRNDPGTPLGQCYNAGGTVFRRKYTRADVELDCSEWRGAMKFHS